MCILYITYNVHCSVRCYSLNIQYSKLKLKFKNTGLGGGGFIGSLSFGMDDSREDRGSRRPSEPAAAARPVSARVAKKAVAAAGRQVPRVDDEKELAIRRAIARRLRDEVLNKEDAGDDDDR